MIFVWIVRGVLLLFLVPVLFPVRLLIRRLALTPMTFALLTLALALLALAIVFGLLLGVLGRLVDVLLLLGLIGIAWNWPRGIRASFSRKLHLAYRGLRNAFARQVRCFTLVDFVLCFVTMLIAIVLSLSSGFLHFFLMIFVVLTVIGVIWKWPRSPHLPFLRKLKLALRSLWDDLRSRFR